MPKTSPEQNKALVLEAFDTLFNKRDYEAAARFWSDIYIQHSAHIEPERDGLFNLIRSTPGTLRYEHQLIVADGDYVMVHGRFSGTGRPSSWVAADIVRIENGRTRARCNGRTAAPQSPIATWMPAEHMKPPHWSSAVTLLIGLVSISLNLNWSRLMGQTTGESPRFEVASVKVNRAEDGKVFINGKGTRYVASGVTLRLLLRLAYDVQGDQISGGPKWIDTARFDIVATEKEGTPHPVQVIGGPVTILSKCGTSRFTSLGRT